MTAIGFVETSHGCLAVYDEAITDNGIKFPYGDRKVLVERGVCFLASGDVPVIDYAYSQAKKLLPTAGDMLKFGQRWAHAVVKGCGRKASFDILYTEVEPDGQRLFYQVTCHGACEFEGPIATGGCGSLVLYGALAMAHALDLNALEAQFGLSHALLSQNIEGVGKLRVMKL